MRVLLDTYTFLWFIDDNPRLSRVARRLIEDGATIPFLSVASLWEMAIKVSLGNLTVSDKPFETFIRTYAVGFAFLGGSRLSSLLPRSERQAGKPATTGFLW